MDFKKCNVVMSFKYFLQNLCHPKNGLLHNLRQVAVLLLHK